MTLRIQDFHLTLLPQNAVLLDRNLILADTHFGKSAAFRARGIPIPEGDTEQDTGRILELLDRHQPERLVIAGDFLHAPEGRSPAVFDSLAAFLSDLSCPVHLVLGNHDLRSGSLPSDWPISTHESLALGQVSIVHDPADLSAAAHFTICGHLHPVARIKDGRHTGFRAPCFWLREQSLVLPSFGTFTGGAIAHPAEHDRIFVPLHQRVVEIPASAL